RLRARTEEEIRPFHLRFPNADDRRRDVVFPARQGLSTRRADQRSSASDSRFGKSGGKARAGITKRTRCGWIDRQAVREHSAPGQDQRMSAWRGVFDAVVKMERVVSNALKFRVRRTRFT